jgi:UPF0755 protein
MAKSRTSTRLFVATAILALPPGYAAWSWKRSGPTSDTRTVLVKKGATVDQVAAQLERDGVIRSATLFKLWARARQLQVIRGEYTFQPRASLADIAGKLRRGEVTWTSVNIPTGAHAWTVQKRVQAFVPEDTFWALWKSPALAQAAGFPDAPSLEGLVAPATFRFNHAQEPEEVMLQLVEAFARQVKPALEGGQLAPYETLILASLAEKETNVPEELPKVAGVYALRLRIGMRLQCDPTSLYARWLRGDLRFTAPMKADVEWPHPFNTYTVAGLPPTPIAVPSAAAIAAAKAPEITGDLYFVATRTGGHNFAKSLAQHNRNVALYRAELSRAKKGG